MAHPAGRGRLCTRCGALLPPPAPGSAEGAEGTCPECGLGFAWAPLAARVGRPRASLSRWPPAPRWPRPSPRRRPRRAPPDAAERARQVRRCGFPLYGLDASFEGRRWVGGHGTSIGGAIIDSGNFDWAAVPERQPMLNTPDPSYHGAIWVEAVKPLGPIAYIIRARTVLLRDEGAALSPFNAFQLIQGIETVALRMERHCSNAAAVVKHLQGRDDVTRVIHPLTATGEAKRRAETYLKGGMGALVGFELAGGAEAGRRFIDALQMFYHVANIGDARSLAIHPASTTHSQLSEADQAATGVTPGYVRLSIGIEHIDDIIADLDQALNAAKVAKAA